ncbi:MAG: hypothetical protein FWF19_05095 [Euryarchaeota archaeon]|nr:hypothetical protein [Euryarchaeota archaeon]
MRQVFVPCKGQRQPLVALEDDRGSFLSAFISIWLTSSLSLSLSLSSTYLRAIISYHIKSIELSYHIISRSVELSYHIIAEDGNRIDVDIVINTIYDVLPIPSL